MLVKENFPFKKNITNEVEFYDGVFTFWTLEFSPLYPKNKLILRFLKNIDSESIIKKNIKGFLKIRASSGQEVLDWLIGNQTHYSLEDKVFKLLTK